MQTMFVHKTRDDFSSLIEKHSIFNIKEIDCKLDGQIYHFKMKEFPENCELDATIIRKDVLLIFEENHRKAIMEKKFLGLESNESYDNFMKDCPDKVICLGLELKVL